LKRKKPPKAKIVESDANIPPRGAGRKREALTSTTRTFPRVKPEAAPRGGWVRAIREALGISQSQIAARAGVSRATVQQWERAEARRRITLHSLDRIAAAMGCQVALALVPKGGSLDDVRRRQAKTRAFALLRSTDKSFVDAKPEELTAAQTRRLERVAARLLRGSPRKLWRI
jgi:predicted DNA-binding mobile mystery protein A